MTNFLLFTGLRYLEEAVAGEAHEYFEKSKDEAIKSFETVVGLDKLESIRFLVASELLLSQLHVDLGHADLEARLKVSKITC